MSRIYHLKGAPYEIGLAMGQALGPRLGDNITRYIHQRIPPDVPFNKQAWRRGALPWLRELPERFLEEYEGLANGSGLPLQRLAEWAYLEALLNNACSGAILTVGGHAWVARNNDMYVPDMWGYVTIREVTGRIPAMCFGLEGDVFTPTGVNQEKLWLHYNWLPAGDLPEAGKFQLPAYAFLVEALETCRTLQDVEKLMLQVPRDGGMLLFAVDGKTDEFALYECTCAGFTRLAAEDGWIVGANHYCAFPVEEPPQPAEPLDSFSRYRRLQALAAAFSSPAEDDSSLRDSSLRDSSLRDSPVKRLVAMLADDEIERRSGEVQTVYSNVACPATGEIWYTFGGYPAASRGDWGRLEWPWDNPAMA